MPDAYLVEYTRLRGYGLQCSVPYIRNISYALTIEIDLFEPSAYKPLIKKNFQLTSI